MNGLEQTICDSGAINSLPYHMTENNEVDLEQIKHLKNQVFHLEEQRQ